MPPGFRVQSEFETSTWPRDKRFAFMESGTGFFRGCASGRVLSASAFNRLSCSLIVKIKFPDNSEKFPVPPRREFGRKKLTYIFETKSPSGLETRIRENCLYFPGYQGIWRERRVRCSLPAQPTSRVFSELSPDRRQSVRKKPGIAPPIDGRPIWLGGRERVLTLERGASPGLSLRGLFGGHTS